MSKRSKFLKMYAPLLLIYDLWGLDAALEKAKEMGLEVRDKVSENLLNELLKKMQEKSQ